MANAVFPPAPFVNCRSALRGGPVNALLAVATLRAELADLASGLASGTTPAAPS